MKHSFQYFPPKTDKTKSVIFTIDEGEFFEPIPASKKRLKESLYVSKIEGYENIAIFSYRSKKAGLQAPDLINHLFTFLTQTPDIETLLYDWRDRQGIATLEMIQEVIDKWKASQKGLADFQHNPSELAMEFHLAIARLYRKSKRS